eukprot:gene40469-49324_t
MLILILLVLATLTRAFNRHSPNKPPICNRFRHKLQVQTPYRDEFINNARRPIPVEKIVFEDRDTEEDAIWEGKKEGFDWHLEQARRLLEGPAFAPIRMTLWKPVYNVEKPKAEQLGLAQSVDGAPLVQ